MNIRLTVFVINSKVITCLKFSTSNSNFNAFNLIHKNLWQKNSPAPSAAYFAKLPIIVKVLLNLCVFIILRSFQ